MREERLETSLRSLGFKKQVGEDTCVRGPDEQSPRFIHIDGPTEDTRLGGREGGTTHCHQDGEGWLERHWAT